MKNLRGHNTIHLNAETVKAIFNEWFQSGTYAVKGELTEVVDVSYVVDTNTIVVSTTTTFKTEEPKA